MTVRAMQASDRAAIDQMRRLLWPDDDRAGDGETVLVWEDGRGSCGGFVSLGLRPWADGCLGGPVPYVEGWFVREDLRRCGIGRALIEAAEAWARSAGFDELGSDARLDNPVGLRAHRRLGFEPTERLQAFRKDLRPAAPEPYTIARFDGPRAELRPLFELAEDSPAELDRTIGDGEVYVALVGAEPIGHVQIVEHGDRHEIEVLNLAVRTDRQGRGIGRALVETVVELARARRRNLRLATAAADIDNLRFYQRLGFRLERVERDAFGPSTGYPEGLLVDGIPLRDRVWFTLDVQP